MRLSNPIRPIAPTLRAASLAVAAVLLIAGAGLLFQIDHDRSQWPWPIMKVNASE